MADQQAWDDFKVATSIVEQAGAEAAAMKDLTNRLEALVVTLDNDQPRLAALAALADTHHKWTAAALLDMYNKLLAVRAYLISQGL